MAMLPPGAGLGLTTGRALGYTQGVQAGLDRRMQGRQMALQERQQYASEKERADEENRLRMQLMQDIRQAERQMQFSWAQLDVGRQVSLVNALNDYERNRMAFRGQDIERQLAGFNAATAYGLQTFREGKADERQQRDWVQNFWDGWRREAMRREGEQAANAQEAMLGQQNMDRAAALALHRVLTENDLELEKERRQAGYFNQMMGMVEPGGQMSGMGVSVRRGTPPAPPAPPPSPRQPEPQAGFQPQPQAQPQARQLTPSEMMRIREYVANNMRGPAGQPGTPEFDAAVQQVEGQMTGQAPPASEDALRSEAQQVGISTLQAGINALSRGRPQGEGYAQWQAFYQWGVQAGFSPEVLGVIWQRAGSYEQAHAYAAELLPLVRATR